MAAQNREFAILLGRAFLKEVEKGHKDLAIAYGRAFLIALGKRGPEPKKHRPALHGGLRAEVAEAVH